MGANGVTNKHTHVHTHTHSQVKLLPLDDIQQWAWVSSDLLPFIFTHRLGTNSVQFPATKNKSFCSRISSACGSCTVGVSLWIFCIYLLICTWRLECCFWAFVIIFASYKILFSVYFLLICSKNKPNKLIYLKTECFSRFFCGCTVNFVHCVSVCPTEEHFAFCISF